MAHTQGFYSVCVYVCAKFEELSVVVINGYAVSFKATAFIHSFSSTSLDGSIKAITEAWEPLSR